MRLSYEVNVSQYSYISPNVHIFKVTVGVLLAQDSEELTDQPLCLLSLSFLCSDLFCLSLYLAAVESRANGLSSISSIVLSAWLVSFALLV